MEAFEYQGIWWLPGQEDKKACGTLAFSGEDGLPLTLIAPLDEGINPTELFNGKLEQEPVILVLQPYFPGNVALSGLYGQIPAP